MLFEGQLAVTHAETGADPLAAPADVPPAQIVALAKRAPGCDITGRRILLALDAGAGETVTVTLWALDEGTLTPNANAPDAAARRFYTIASAVVVTRGILQEVTTKVPPGGDVYVQVTADAMAAGGTLRLACVP